MTDNKSEKTTGLVTVLPDSDLDSVNGGGGFWNYQAAGSGNVNTNIAQNNTLNLGSFNVRFW